jgi:hypothetical protein
MKRSAIVLLLLPGALAGIAIVNAAIAADAGSDSLWMRAVRLSELSRDLVPGSVESYMQEVDKHGQPKDEDKYSHSWGRIYLRDDGEVSYQSVKVIKDGKDITDEERAKEREREENQKEDEDSESFSSGGYSPFNPDAQGRVSIERLGGSEGAAGRDLVRYKFVERPADKGGEEFSGTAWFDEDAGIPVRIEYTTDPLPKHVKRMLTTIEYTYSAPDTLVPARMIFDGSGGFLFIKKHFHGEMEFSDYWRLPEGYEGPGGEN